MQTGRDQRLIQIVEAALREAPELRAAFLRSAVNGDEELLAEASDLLTRTGSDVGSLTSWAAEKAAQVLFERTLLIPGDRLGPYEIERRRATGGMGDVYEATDLRLRRKVAIKILTGGASDADSRARILQEARILSRLSHPSICTVHDVGVHAGVPFLVMELLEGPTLRQVLKSDRLSRSAAIEWAIQIAEALHHAHAAGIVHRDVKPENVVITQRRAKLVDFGISALSTVPDSSSTPAGTLQYMAPEVVLGDRATAHSDVYAFGLLLREMMPEAVDEERPGRGISQGDSTATFPNALAKLTAACLVNDPAERWQSAGDAAATLRWILQGSFDAATSRPRSKLFGVAAAAVVLATLWIGFVLWRTASPGDRVHSFTVDAEPGTKLLRPVEISVSPDGKSLAFVAIDHASTRIYVRPLNEAHARPVVGTEMARRPFWSPDSTTLGFFADRKLKRIAVSGGPALIVCDAAQDGSGSWGSSGQIVFSGSTGPVYKVDAAGGVPHAITTLNSKNEDGSHRWPSFLADGTHFLYTANSNRHEGKVYVGSLSGGAAVYVVNTPAQAVVSGRTIYYLRGTSLVSRGFDSTTFRTFGDTVPLAQGIAGQGFSPSSAGTIAFCDRVTMEPAQLTWVDRNGKTLASIGPPALYTGVVLAPKGDAVIATICDSIDCQDPTNPNYVRRYNLRMIDAGGNSSVLTNDEAVAATPLWSPSGNEIVYGSTRAGHMDLYKRDLKTGREISLLPGGIDRGSTSWSPDGRYLAYTELRPTTAFDIWILDLSSARRTLFRGTTAAETLASFSPDGKWIAYASDETGNWQVYVAPFLPTAASGGTSESVRISGTTGMLPLWRRDGTELYFYAGSDLMAVKIDVAHGRLVATPPRTLFPLRRIGNMGNSYAVAPDGSRFLILDGPMTNAEPITVQMR